MPILTRILALVIPTAFAAIFDASNPGDPLGEGIDYAAGITGLATGPIDVFINTTMGRVISTLGILATVAIVVAGLYLVLGFGNESSKEKAKNIIIYTIVGIVVIILAGLIVNTVSYILGAPGGVDPLPTVLDITSRVVSFLALAATVAIVVAGMYLVLGFGDESSKDKAKKIIIYTIVGIVLVALAGTIVNFVYFVLGDPIGNDDIRDIITGILLSVLNFMALAATIVVVVAGIIMVVSFGEEERYNTAKRMITYALIGLVIIFFSRLIVGFITTYLFD